MRSQSLSLPVGGIVFPRWSLRVLLLLVLLAVTLSPAFAQAGSGPSPAATMNTVKNIAYVALQGMMAIGMMIGLVKVAKNFMNGSPEALSSFFWLIGGTVIFFVWGNFFRTSLGTWSAASAAIGNIGNGNLNPGVSSGAYAMAQKVLDTMLTTVVPLLLFTTVALTVVRGFISSGSVQFELGPIFRVFFLYGVLVSYNVLVPQVGNLIGGVADLIKSDAGSSSTSAYKVLEQLRTQADNEKKGPGAVTTTNPQQAGNSATDGPGLMSGLATSISTTFSDLTAAFSPQKILMGLATDFMTSLIQAIMEFIQSFLLAFLYVAGPIAITFSLVPGFGGVAKSWLQSLIGIHMWSIAFQVIAGVFAHYQAYEAAYSNSSAGQALANMTGVAQTKFAVACIVFIVMYIMVPYMSSLIVGSSAADSFVSSAVRIGASLASGGAAAGGAALGVAGAGATGANAVAAQGGGVAAQAVGFGRAAASHVQNGLGMGPGGNMSAIGTMLSGSQAPTMAGATKSEGRPSADVPQPPRFTPSAAAPSGVSVSAQSMASSSPVVSSAPQVSSSGAPAAASMPGSSGRGSVASTVPDMGGSAGGFGSSGNWQGKSRPAVAPVAPVAIAAGEAPPSLTA